MNINNIDTNKVTVKTSNINQIKIPMIQRDYVQGLDKKKLEPFLHTLIDTLLNGQKLSLDFIYGNINEDGVFEPIDGQQRLTTLALLTFYLYCRQKGSDNNKTLNNPFKLITYATRQSAKKFCELLSKDEFKDKFDNSVVPSNVIKKNPKYFSEYDEDTTISAMLKTLDKIHEIICKENIDINRLIEHLDNITFHIFPMESFNLSDDLYIKMNGRGKQLSSFDNFKAEYFKWLEDASDDNIDKLIPNCILQKNTQNKLETLKRKFDTEYLDIFWDYAFENIKKTKEVPDPEGLFFNFIKNYIVDKYLILSIKETATSINNSDIIKQINNDSIEYQNLYIHLLKQNNYNYILLLILEFLSKEKYRNNFLNLIKPIWDTDNSNLNMSYLFMDSDITWKDRAVLHTIFIYLEQMLLCHTNDFSTLDFSDNRYFSQVMRYIWNIIENHTNLDTSYRLYDLIYNLDNNYYKHNIYKNSIYTIASNHNNEDTYVIKQENLKAKKIFDNMEEDWEQEFINIEKHKYFKGDIYFLINDIFSNNITSFQKRIDIVSKLFTKEGLIDELKDNHLFIRGILSQFNDNDFNLLTRYSYFDDSYKGEHGFLNNYSHIINHLLDTNENIDAIICSLKENITHKSNINQHFINIAHEIIYKTCLLNQLIKNKNRYIRTFHNCKINLWGCTAASGPSYLNYICIDIIKAGIIGRLKKVYGFNIQENIKSYDIEYLNELFSFYENFSDRKATFTSYDYPDIILEISNFKFQYEGNIHWNGIIIKKGKDEFEYLIDYNTYINNPYNISKVIDEEIKKILHSDDELMKK